MLSFMVLLTGLTACDAAGPGFRGVPKVEREVEGSRFTLRRTGNVVEAIRTNPEVLPRFQPIARKAGIAAQLETGCNAEWVVGDPSQMRVGLSCDGGKPPPKPKGNRLIVCDLYKSGQGTGSLDCSL